MKVDVFAELMESAAEALEHARGKRELRTIILPDPPEPMNPAEVKRLRKRLSASQAVFARCLNVSTKLVQAWEADRREPDGAALRLLRLAEHFPALIFAGITDRPGRAGAPKSSKLRKAAGGASGRASRRDRQKFQRVLKKVRSHGRPPIKGDEL
jgi:putative transcriptional regulator